MTARPTEVGDLDPDGETDIPIPETVAADPGHHTSDHQSIVEGPATVVPTSHVTHEDLASVPAAGSVDTRTGGVSRVKIPSNKLPAPTMVESDPGDGRQSQPKTPATVWDTNHPRDGRRKPSTSGDRSEVPQPHSAPPVGDAVADPDSNEPNAGRAADDASLATAASPPGVANPKRGNRVRFDSQPSDKEHDGPPGRTGQ